MTEFIDFKMLPVDTVVEVKIRPDDHSQTAYFAGIIDPDYGVCVFPDGASSKTSIQKGIALTGHYFRRVRISDKNPWLPWFGGDCPVPPNCMVDVRYQADINQIYDPIIASKCVWRHDNCSFFGPSLSNIIAYRLAESQWQTIDGVCNE
jgi:hypothetical protein